MYRIALLLNGRYVDSREFSTYEHCIQSVNMYARQGYEVRYVERSGVLWAIQPEVEQ